MSERSPGAGRRAPRQRIFDDRARLASELAAAVAALLQEATGDRHTASLMLSGGSTPVPLLQELSRRELPWASVAVGLVDERWVPPGDPSSNAGLVRRHLLQGPAAGALFVPMYGGEQDPEEGEEACERRLRSMPRPFDVLVLGMGEDGHTASLFPGAARLREALVAPRGRSCIAIRPPAAPHARMSLTVPALLEARRIFLMITGDAKRRVLDDALGGSDYETLPIRAVLHQAPQKTEIYWAP